VKKKETLLERKKESYVPGGGERGDRPALCGGKKRSTSVEVHQEGARRNGSEAQGKGQMGHKGQGECSSIRPS